MKKWNAILVVAITVTLLIPATVVGSIAGACCGVDVAGLEVSDTPDPACVGGTVTISGSYIAHSPWGEWTEDYDTGVEIRIYDSATNMVDEYLETIAVDQPDPGDLPDGTQWDFSYDWTAGAADVYTYTVIAWSETSWGRMEITVAGETITAEDCVEIDIKPGSYPNSINLKSKGVIPVAILSSPTFDATAVDPGSVTFGPANASPERWALEDVDGDGDTDMILHFRTQDVGLSATDTTASLTCTAGGTTYTVADSVNIVPKGK